MPSSLPPWLTGPVNPETKGLMPDWLDDLRLWYALETLPPVGLSSSPPKQKDPGVDAPTRSSGLPEWVADWIPAANTKDLAGLVAPGAVSHPTPPSPPSAPSPLAIAELPPGSSEVSTPSIAETALATAPSHCRPEDPSLPLVRGRKSASDGVDRVESEPVHGAADVLVEKAIQDTGFDPQTGRIVDLGQFDKWKQQVANISGTDASASNASLMEEFHRARHAIDDWVDEDGHRALILSRDLGEIIKNPDLLGILEKFRHHGPAFQEKLYKRLAFMVENRKQFYLSRLC